MAVKGFAHASKLSSSSLRRSSIELLRLVRLKDFLRLPPRLRERPTVRSASESHSSRVPVARKESAADATRLKDDPARSNSMGSDLDLDLDVDLDVDLVRVKDDPVRVNSLSPPADSALRNDPQRFDDGERLNSTGFVQLLLLVVPLVDRLRPRELGRESLTMIYVVSAQDVLVFQDAEIPKKEAKGLPSSS